MQRNQVVHGAEVDFLMQKESHPTTIIQIHGHSHFYLNSAEEANFEAETQKLFFQLLRYNYVSIDKYDMSSKEKKLSKIHHLDIYS
jgi:hypothetical protein